MTTDEYPDFGTTSNLINKLLFDGGLVKNNQIGVLSLCNMYSQKEIETINGITIFRTVSYYALHKESFFSVIKDYNILLKIFAIIVKTLGWMYEKSGSYSRLLRPENVIRIKRTLEVLANGDFDYVIPISGNYDSVVAVLLSNISAKKIFWQVDPCTTNLVRLKREKLLSKIVEKRIINEFDLILTDEIYFNELVKMYGDKTRESLRVFNLPLIQCLDEKHDIRTFDKTEEINCIFSGLIYLGIRDPEYTIKMFIKLSEIMNLKLHLYGPEQSDVPYKCSDAIIFHGKVEKEKMDEIIVKADFLVNIGNKMTNQIPSKIYEYISLGLPIINICKNYNCPTITLLENYSNSITIFEDDNKFEDQLKSLKAFIVSHRGLQMDRSDILHFYENYIPKNVSDKLIDYLKKL